MQFQFTHPGKGATPSLNVTTMPLIGFNSRTLGRVRHFELAPSQLPRLVSIHAPWEGCDIYGAKLAPSRRGFNSRTLGRVRQGRLSLDVNLYKFQFTHPGKGATVHYFLLPNDLYVSIHAPWEGCDLAFLLCKSLCFCFNSRTLGRVRRNSRHIHLSSLMFQFTHPGKGATFFRRPKNHFPRFQFTHPGKGATSD